MFICVRLWTGSLKVWLQQTSTSEVMFTVAHHLTCRFMSFAICTRTSLSLGRWWRYAKGWETTCCNVFRWGDRQQKQGAIVKRGWRVNPLARSNKLSKSLKNEHNPNSKIEWHVEANWAQYSLFVGKLIRTFAINSNFSGYHEWTSQVSDLGISHKPIQCGARFMRTV